MTVAVAPSIGLPLEEQKATVIHCTASEAGWVVLAQRWSDITPYVVWYCHATSSETSEKFLSFYWGSYFFEHEFGDAIKEYANRGGAL